MDVCSTIIYVFKLRLHFVEIMDLVGLTCSIANHIGVVTVLLLM